MMIPSNLLQALIHPDEIYRKPATEQLESMSVRDRAAALLETMEQQNLALHLQQLVAVLLRRDILKFKDCEALIQMVPPLLQVYMRGENKKMVGECLAEICGGLAWREHAQSVNVMQEILHGVAPPATQGDVDSIKLLATLAQKSPLAFVDVGVPDQLPALVASVPDTVAVLHVVVATAYATSRKGQVFTSKAALLAPPERQVNIYPQSAASQMGQSCLMPLLSQIQALDDESILLDCFESLTAAAETVPSLLAGSPAVFHAVLETCLLHAVGNNTAGCNVAMASIQVLVTLTGIPNIKRQYSLDPLFPALQRCMQIMDRAIDTDVQGWATSDPSDSWEGDEDADHAEFLLCQLIQNVGAKGLSQVILPAVQSVLDNSGTPSPSWTSVRAALAALTVSMEAAPATMQVHAGTAVQMALQFLNHGLLRIQYQAIMLTGLLCDVHPDIVWGEHSQRVLQGLSHATLSPCPKVASVACLALVSFCRPSSNNTTVQEETILPHLSSILSILVSGPMNLQVVSTSAAMVKARAVSVLACLAQVSGPHFAPYYGQVMPLLLSTALMPDQGNYEITQLKGAALEAATIVGQSLGEEHADLFAQDARRILEWAIPALGGGMEQLLPACARIASVMKESYEPYAKDVLPFLLRQAMEPADIDVTDGNDADINDQDFIEDENGTESMTIAVPGQGIKKITIHTAKIQEKVQAARAIYEHVVALGECFGPYSEQFLNAFLELVTFKYNAEVRAVASQTLAAMFDCVCNYGEEHGMDIPAKHFPQLVRALSTQIQTEASYEKEALLALAESLSEICGSVYYRLDEAGDVLIQHLSLEDSDTAVKICMTSIKECLDRRSKLAHAVFDGSVTTEDERYRVDCALKEEEELLTPLVDSVGYMLKYFRERFIQVFETDIAPVLAPLLANHPDTRAKFAAICLFDDCVEFCGPSANVKFSPLLIKGVIEGMDDSHNGGDDDLKRVSIYGVAQMARYSPKEIISPHIHAILEALALTTNIPRGSYSNAMVFENAISALASLVLFPNSPFRKSGHLKFDSVLETVLSNLPLSSDCDEAKICHSGLCDLVECGDVTIAAHCERLIRIIAEILVLVNEGEEVATEETLIRFVGILFRMQQEANPSTMQIAFRQLSGHAQELINSAMNEYGPQVANVVSP